MIPENVRLFLNEKEIAVAGLSTDKNSTSYMVEQALLERNHIVHGINPKFETGGNRYSEISELPDHLKAIIIMTPKEQVVRTINEAIMKGIEKFWLYLGVSSVEAEKLLRAENKIYVPNRCVLMYLHPVKGIHKFHSFVHNLFNLDKKFEDEHV